MLCPIVDNHIISQHKTSRKLDEKCRETNDRGLRIRKTNINE